MRKPTALAALLFASSAVAGVPPPVKAPTRCIVSFGPARRAELTPTKASFDTSGAHGSGRVFVFETSGGGLAVKASVASSNGSWMSMQPYALDDTQAVVEVSDASGGKEAIWRAARDQQGSSLKLKFISTRDDGPQGTLHAKLKPLAQTGAKRDVDIQCSF